MDRGRPPPARRAQRVGQNYFVFVGGGHTVGKNVTALLCFVTARANEDVGEVSTTYVPSMLLRCFLRAFSI